MTFDDLAIGDRFSLQNTSVSNHLFRKETATHASKECDSKDRLYLVLGTHEVVPYGWEYHAKSAR